MKGSSLLSKVLGGILTVAVAFTGAVCLQGLSTPLQVQAKDSVTVTGSYSDVVEGFDWGPGVTKLILHLDQKVQGDVSGALDASAFQVVTTKAGYAADYSKTVTTEKRTIQSVYTCNSDGSQITGESAYIAIDMAVSPTEGSPFYYSLATSLNEWSTPYEQSITLVKSITSGTQTIDKLDISKNTTGHSLKQASKFKKGSYTYVGGAEAKTLNYANYECTSSSNKKGLVIWLHGTGEGGTDTDIALLGNKVTNLASAEIQTALKDSDILVAQCPSRWLTYQTGVGKDSVNTADKYSSEYTKALMGLIEDYVKNHSDIDNNRIYIGGASNGGSMTMNMLLNYPDYFAAAYFASEGYADRYISDEQIQTIKNIPMWFVYAEGDTTNEPAKTTKATYDRLVAAGASNVYLSYYPEGVIDISGKYKNTDETPYKYSNHWSWVYLLNNNCTDGNMSIMSWLGSQNKAKKTQEIQASDITKNYGQKAFSINAVRKTGDGEISYSSSNKSVATINADGIVTMKGYGKTTITIQLSGTTSYRECKKEITLTVKPAKVTSVNAKASGKGAILVSWKKDKNATGYEIAYSTKKDFKSDTKKLLVKKNSVSSKKVLNCKSGKTIYVKVRSYKTVDGKKIYGAYSTVKKISVK